MNFLNPLMLAGLAAAALPVLIHLLSRRRPKDVLFPSIDLLEGMKSDRMRRLRLKQFILLAMRMLALILIALAFARPALNTVFAGSARTTAVIVIDASAGMRSIYDGEQLFTRAVRKAREILDTLGDDDTAAVVLAGGGAQVLRPGITSDTARLREGLAAAAPAWSGDDCTAAAAKALELLDASAFPNRELFIIGDGADDSLPDSLSGAAGKAHVYAVLVGPAARAGALLDDVRCTDRLRVAGSPVAAEARGTAAVSGGGTDVAFFVNGERVGRTAVEAVASDFLTSFTFTPEEPGWYSLAATTDDNASGPGGTVRSVVHIPGTIRVLLAGDTDGDVYYLRRALDPDPERRLFSVKPVTAGALDPADVAAADVIVLSGVTAMSAAVYDALVSAVVQRGAGLVVFMPVTLDEALYADGIFRDIIPLSAGRTVAARTGGAVTSIESFTATHPLFRDVFGEGDVYRPAVRSYVRLGITGVAGTLARFGDGSPALVGALAGRGRVIVSAVGATLEAGDLPLSGVFVPLVIGSVQYAAGTGFAASVYESGQAIVETLGDVEPDTQVTVRTDGAAPRVVDMVMTPDGAATTGLVAGEPGFYSLFAGERERARFAVNVPMGERRFTRAGDDRWIAAFGARPVTVIGDDESIADIMRRERYGTELMLPLLLAAALMLLAEMLVSRKV